MKAGRSNIRETTQQHILSQLTLIKITWGLFEFPVAAHLLTTFRCHDEKRPCVISARQNKKPGAHETKYF